MHLESTLVWWGMTLGVGHWQRLLRLVPREAEEDEVVGSEGGNGHLRLLPLLYKPLRRVCSVSVLLGATPGERRQEGSFQQKDPKGNVLYMQSIVLLSFQMECLLKKPISLTTALKGGTVLRNRRMHLSFLIH